MMRYVAFLRAINVGGRVVKMDHLRTLFEEMGFSNVKTFIASGNVLFDSSAKSTVSLEGKIGKALKKSLGYEVAVFIRTASELESVCAQGGDIPEQGALYVGFLPAPLDAREKKLVASLASPVDDLQVHQREVYWRAAQRFSDAVFQPARMEKLLGKPSTFRSITTVRKIAALLARVVLLSVLLPSPTFGQADLSPIIPWRPTREYRATMLQQWSEAVLRHQAGSDDASVAWVSSWSADELSEAWLIARVMPGLLRNPERIETTVGRFGGEEYVSPRSEDASAVIARVRGLRRDPGRDLLLKRAALLHTDVALMADRHRRRGPFNTSFLLPNRAFLLSGDGTPAGGHRGNVHWEFARILLDGVDDPTRDDDVLLWYRATLTHLVAVEQYDNPHFEHGVRLFPRDPEMRHLAGCLHEALSSPRVQRVRSELASRRSAVLDVAPERAELSAAASWFRRAVEQSPAHGEARLRLGRAMGRLGRTAEAASELRRAYRDVSEPRLAYYAALFVGAEEEALGRLADAEAMYQRAAELYPQAQAPRLALSQLAHRRGDRSAARAALDILLNRHADDTDDPWWTFFSSCGRSTDARLAQFYGSVVRTP